MDTKGILLELVRLGIGVDKMTPFPERVNWSAVHALAYSQGLSTIVLDGVDHLSEKNRPPKALLFQWIGETMREEASYESQQKAAMEMAILFSANNIRTYVLKGIIVSECYPKPNHRRSADMDCFLLPSNNQDVDVWEDGNKLMEQAGFEVKRNYYKNSTIYVPGLVVENHHYMTPYRGNKRMKLLEALLQEMIKKDRGEDIVEGTCLCRPPVMFSAIFLIEHAYSHFLHEGLTWRHVLDWMMFSRKHKDDIDWNKLESLIDEFGFRKFYHTYYKMGKLLLGEITDKDLSDIDKKMLADIWERLDLHKSNRGIKGKLELAGNTWRARWKYKYFSEISMFHALWIQAKGVLILKNPKLD